MATVETVLMNDDLDNRIQNGVETVTFYDPRTGQKREIELGETNRRHLEAHFEKLDKYIDVSRVVEAAPKKAAKAQKGNLDAVRVWARANGYQVGDRGRIAVEILNAYAAAQATVDVEAQANTQARADATGRESAPEVVSEPTPAEDTDETVSDADKAPEAVATETKRPATEDELQDMLREMAVKGEEPTLDDLKLA